VFICGPRFSGFFAAVIAIGLGMALSLFIRK
jgi:hypothetical protein